MQTIVQVRLREAGKISAYDPGELKPHSGDYVIVEVERGSDYGQALTEPEVTSKKGPGSIKKVLRIATKEDKAQIENNKQRSKDVVSSCNKKINERKLDMKLICAEYSFDRSKLIFYFTAEGRIDFRDLVKDLASQV